MDSFSLCWYSIAQHINILTFIPGIEQERYSTFNTIPVLCNDCQKIVNFSREQSNKYLKLELQLYELCYKMGSAIVRPSGQQESLLQVVYDWLTLHPEVCGKIHMVGFLHCTANGSYYTADGYKIPSAVVKQVGETVSGLIYMQLIKPLAVTFVRWRRISEPLAV